jgi:hypothetical protein
VRLRLSAGETNPDNGCVSRVAVERIDNHIRKFLVDIDR